MEPIAVINQRLRDRYGLAEDNQPRYRLVHASEQTELRKDFFKNESVLTIHHVLKYPQSRDKWVLEQLLPVLNNTDGSGLCAKFSYEPLWIFGKKGDPYGEPIEPNWEALEFLIWIHTQNKFNKNPNYAHYKEGDPMEARAESIKKIEEYLYGNETSVGDALATKNAIVRP